MGIHEVSQKELVTMLSNGEDRCAIYIYTPWCGTCRYGENMLNVVITIVPNLKLFKSNINYLPLVSNSWKIESVPCLVFLEAGHLTDKIYTIHSVEFLLAKVRQMMLR
jgi:thioredoxin 1